MWGHNYHRGVSPARHPVATAQPVPASRHHPASPSQSPPPSQSQPVATVHCSTQLQSFEGWENILVTHWLYDLLDLWYGHVISCSVQKGWSNLCLVHNGALPPSYAACYAHMWFFLAQKKPVCIHLQTIPRKGDQAINFIYQDYL